MKFKLYRSEVIGSDGKTVLHVVAACIEMVSEVIRDHYQARGIRLTRTATKRVDESLGPRRQLGLQSMLETAPTGLATYILKHGWMVYDQVRLKLKLFRVDELSGEQSFVIAPNAYVAAAVWGVSLKLNPGKQRPYKVSDGFENLVDDRHRGLDELLTSGPIGLIAYKYGHGWFMAK